MLLKSQETRTLQLMLTGADPRGGAPGARPPVRQKKKKKRKRKGKKRKKEEREKTVPFSILLLVSKLAMWQRLSHVAD